MTDPSTQHDQQNLAPQNLAMMANLRAAQRKLGVFLDDPEYIIRFNAHIETITDKYSDLAANSEDAEPYLQNLARFYCLQGNLQIDPDRIQSYKDMIATLTLVIDPTLQDAAMANMAEKQILVSSRFMDYSASTQQKIMLHEMHHMLMFMNCSENDQLFLLYKTKHQNHAEEIVADGFSDHVMAWPHIGLMFLENIRNAKEQALQEVASHYAQRNPEADPRIWQQAISNIQARYQQDDDAEIDAESETHPSVNQRIAHSADVTEKLSEFRSNTYLERLYDGFVADYPDRLIPLYL